MDIESKRVIPHDYFNELDKTIDEFERISSKGIYIGSIRCKTSNQKILIHKYDGVFNHLVIPKEYFINKGYTILNCDYELDERYDVYKMIV